MPISAFLFGGRRAGTVPLVYQARDWKHGVFIGSIIGSEITSAAIDLKAGTVRRDPFAMLPFCGYHMGDYFHHWLDIGARTETDKLPRIFFVNWFRKDSGDRWLWPGYGENSRVLKWVFERVEGTGKALETPIGWMPTLDAIDRPKGVSDADMAELLAVDKEGWLREIELIRNNHYAKFGDRLPGELVEELDSLEKRLRSS